MSSHLSKYLVLLFLILFLPAGSAAQEKMSLEKKLAADISDFNLDEFSLVEAAFILSGASQPDSLQRYLDWYENLLTTLKSFHFDPFDQETSAAKVFNYLHGTWLKKYKEKATTLLNVVNEKRFNCVAGTILFNLVCTDLGWQTEAFETPTHTYTIFPTFSRQLMVENTSSIGFDIMKNLHQYSRYLLQFYPKNQALHIGLDQIYAYENSKGRRINNTELLGLLAYNRAYFAQKEDNYRKAYDFVLLAQNFNQDSRSNIQFEKNLYFKWGKKLFSEQDYSHAFEVFADAAYRYPDEAYFGQNCKATFFNTQIQSWQKKNWPTCFRVTKEIFELNILSNSDRARLKKMLLNWANHFYRTGDRKQSRELIAIWQQLDPDDAKLQDFIQAVNKR